MLNGALQLPVIRLFNRVLADFPAAGVRLQGHQGKTIALQVGPVVTRMRITPGGEMELVGDAGDGPALPKSDVSIIVALSLLPKLAGKDDAALSKIVFSGDAELAGTLSDIARNVEWDVEQDLSRLVGDIAAHRVVDAAHRARTWQREAGQRLTANIAEYLTEERRAFLTTRDLENLARQNESLRDDLARLEARLAKLPAAN